MNNLKDIILYPRGRLFSVLHSPPTVTLKQYEMIRGGLLARTA